MDKTLYSESTSFLLPVVCIQPPGPRHTHDPHAPPPPPCLLKILTIQLQKKHFMTKNFCLSARARLGSGE